MSAFDCEKIIDLPGLAPATGAVRPEQGIRAWRGGGPGGSNWNVGDLRCAVVTESSCKAGKIALALSVGSHLAAERSVPSAKGPVVSELTLPEAKWRARLAAATHSLKALPYRTAVFHLSARLECQSPEAMSLQSTRYPETAADDFFIAGFSSGE